MTEHIAVEILIAWGIVGLVILGIGVWIGKAIERGDW
jgi:hypothetical protein